MKQQLGRRGEDIAAAFLQQYGFSIIARNWRCRLGEIDLIASRAGQVRFIEVKCRLGTSYGYPEEAITPTKLQHLRKAIEIWLQAQAQPPARYQADAISILIAGSGKPDIYWVEAIL